VKEIRSLPRLAPRPPEAHKGQFGHVLVLGGSRGMAGAPCLSGQAALRAGAGLVTVAVPEGIYPIVAAKLTNCMTRPLPEGAGGGLSEEAAADVLDLVERFDVLALGPGLGRSPATVAFVRRLAREAARPMVIDADGLNALAGALDTVGRARAPRLLTPHPGEMARLLGLPGPGEVSRNRLEAARRLVEATGAVVIFKGHGTLVTDGRRCYVNSTGNPGMATGGTGDVLTGVVAALWAQGLTPFESGQLGVYLHGLAGDLAAAAVGEVSLVATDLLEHLPAAIRHATAGA